MLFGLHALAGFAACLHLEGFAVNALALGRICFVSGDADGVQRTVVFAAAVMLALLNGTFNGGIGSLVFHVGFLFQS